VPAGSRPLALDVAIDMILILSENDDHVGLVTESLKELGADFYVFNPADFPANASLTIAFDRRGISRRLLRTSVRVIDLDQVSAVWVRRPRRPQAAEEVHNEEQRQWIALESREFLDGLWQTMDCLWVPGRPRHTHFRYNKIYHLRLAAKLGFTIPDHTVMTNDPDEILPAYTESCGRMVSKGVYLPASAIRDGEQHVARTHFVHRRDLAAYRSVRFVPTIFQNSIPKKIELRVTVVGSRVFAAAIDSQASRVTRDDWRRFDNDRSVYREYRLPLEVEKRCVRLTQALGLCFGTIDFILTPQGEYVFLEINPNGGWTFVQELTNMAIATAIADLLTSASVRTA